MTQSWMGFLAAFGLAVSACKKDDTDTSAKEAEDKSVAAADEKGEPSGEDDADGPGEEAEKDEEKEVARGIEAPDNDSAVVELARTVLECEWNDRGPDSKCEALKSWRDSDLLEKGKADATLVSMLEDTDRKVRWLGAERLSSLRTGTAYGEDEALSRRIVDAAKAETDEHVANQLGSAVGRIRTDKVSFADEIKKLATDHPVERMRTGVLSTILLGNRDVDDVYDFVADLARTSTDAPVRRRAVSAFWVGTPQSRTADTCKLWLELASDDDKEIAGEAAYLCSFFGRGCNEEWDPLLDIVEAKAKEGAIESSQMASALEYLHKQKEASDAQKKRALAIARVLVENSENDGFARARTLRFLAKEDPKAKKLAVSLVDDENASVKRAARDIYHDGGKK
jgi:hypothetical protein